MDINERLQKQSTQIFQKLTDQLMKVSPGTVGTTVFAITSPLIYYSIGAETLQHIDLVNAVGWDAYSARENTNPTGALAFIKQGLMGELSSNNLNLLVRSTVGSVLGGVIAGAATQISQKFVALQKIADAVQLSDKEMMLALAADRAAQSGQLQQGATRLPKDELEKVQLARRESMHSQFSRSLDAFSEQIESTTKSAPRAPGL